MSKKQKYLDRASAYDTIHEVLTNLQHNGAFLDEPLSIQDEIDIIIRNMELNFQRNKDKAEQPPRKPKAKLEPVKKQGDTEYYDYVPTAATGARRGRK